MTEKRIFSNIFNGLFLSFIMSSCTHYNLKTVKSLQIKDDLNFKDFQVNLEQHILTLEKRPETKMSIGHIQVSKQDYLKRLVLLKRFLEKHPKENNISSFIHKNFQIIEVSRNDPGKNILLTSYYSPVLKGSLKPEGKRTRPLYRKPTTAHYTREEIDGKEFLKGQKLEICYVDPIDAFLLQVQGSGKIQLNDGHTLSLVYAGTNGLTYTSLGSSLSQKGILKREDITLETLVTYLRSLSPEDLQKTLNVNESYIYFQESIKDNVTTMGATAVPGRTIATDKKIFSKGFMAYLEFEKPIPTKMAAFEFVKVGRVVLDQDTGSAIKGPGRVDLFWGEGLEAERFAGVMKGPAKLYYFLPK